MCFNLLNRLTWLALVFVSMLTVIAFGLLAYATGMIHFGQRESLILLGGIVTVMAILIAYFWRRIPRSHHVPAPLSQVQPWFNAPPSAPYPTMIQEPPVSTEATPTHPLAPVIVPASAAITSFELIDTRPMHPVHLPPEADKVLEDTKPMKAVQLPIIPTRKPLPPGPYDDLFPPAQPDDEDYLETNHMEAISSQTESSKEGPAPTEDAQQTKDEPAEDAPTEPK